MSSEHPKSDRALLGVVQVASALSLGTLAGVIYSVKSISPTLQFELSLATLLAFAVAAAGSVALWSVVFKLTDEDASSTDPRLANQHAFRQRWLMFLAGCLAGGLVLAFAYPIRHFSRDKLSEIGFGAVIAVVFLGVLSVLFWRIVRYLEHGDRD